MRTINAICAALMFCGVSHGALTLQGSTEDFTGPGVYTFDFTVQAVGQSETILGFTIPLLPINGASPLEENPDVSDSSIEFTPNAAVETKAASSDFGAVGFSITAFDNDNTPLVLTDGESAILFSIPVNVLAAGEVLGENGPLNGLQTITTPEGGKQPDWLGPAVAQSSVVIPEPSSIGLCSLGVIGFACRRRRRLQCK